MASAKELAKRVGGKLINGSNHCRQSDTGRHQAAVPGSLKDKANVVIERGVTYQVIWCRCCEGVMRVMSSGRKN